VYPCHQIFETMVEMLLVDMRVVARIRVGATWLQHGRVSRYLRWLALVWGGNKLKV
jgi:hypothetical protein